MRIVMYRVGTYRTAYHVNGECPALTSKPETGDEWAAVREEEAREELGLKPCARCAA